MQTCTKCAIQPNFHHFEYMGETSMGVQIFYTKPYPNIETKFTRETMNNYLYHLESTKNYCHDVFPFIWIFDAYGLDKHEIPNASLMKEFYKIIDSRYKDSMKKVYILHANKMVQFILGVIKLFVKKESYEKLVLVKGPLELLEEGIVGSMVKRLSAPMSVPTETAECPNECPKRNV